MSHARTHSGYRTGGLWAAAGISFAALIAGSAVALFAMLEFDERCMQGITEGPGRLLRTRDQAFPPATVCEYTGGDIVSFGGHGVLAREGEEHEREARRRALLGVPQEGEVDADAGHPVRHGDAPGHLDRAAEQRRERRQQHGHGHDEAGPRVQAGAAHRVSVRGALPAWRRSAEDPAIRTPLRRARAGATRPGRAGCR